MFIKSILERCFRVSAVWDELAIIEKPIPRRLRDRDRNFRRAECERGAIEQQHLKTLDNLASFCQNFTAQDYIPAARRTEGSKANFRRDSARR